MPSPVDDLVSLSTLPGWEARVLGGGVCVAPVDEWARVEGTDGLPRLSFGASIHRTSETQSADAYLDDLFERRVPNGEPERSHVSVNGRNASCFHWTDGVFDVLSHFVEVGNGQLVELEAAVMLPFRPELPSVGAVAAMFLPLVSWVERSQSSEDVSRNWAVWRQDDNGNRFVVREGLSRDEAEQVCRDFERLGHKQTYWVSTANLDGV